MAVQNSLAPRQKKTAFDVYLTQDAAKQYINKVLSGKGATRFISSLVSAVQANPALQECTNPSLLSAALLGESLNLSPSPQLGQYYLVPFKKKAKYDREGNLISPACVEAQFQLGYKGYIQLAKRSGVYKKINVISIKEGELVSYNPLEEELEVKLIEDDLLREKAPTIGYYAMFEEANGYKHSIYWSKRKMMAHADRYSAAFNAGDLERLERGEIPEKDMWKYSSFWYKDFDSMAHKTMLRQLLSKWGTLSVEMQSAMEADQAVIHEDGKHDYVEMNTGNYAADMSSQEIPYAGQEITTAEPVQEQPADSAAEDAASRFFS